jgi:transcriptional regulator with XRE-family HTH domain
MNRHKRPPFLRRRVGRRLRTLREQAGLTLDEAAPKLDKTRTALHRVETGETRADVHLVRSMMDVYDQYDPDLIDLTRKALKAGWWVSFGVEDMGYTDLETEAIQVREFGGLNIPGLLQTESYMRALFRTGVRRTKKEIESQVAVRRIRQKRLTSTDNELELVTIVDEAALRRDVGGREVMCEQLQHLIQVSDLSTVTLQVLPLGHGPHDAMTGAFILLDFPEPTDPEMLYVEHVTGSLHIEDEDNVRKGKLLFDRLRSDAPSPADSISLIERLISEACQRE